MVLRKRSRIRAEQAPGRLGRASRQAAASVEDRLENTFESLQKVMPSRKQKRHSRLRWILGASLLAGCVVAALAVLKRMRADGRLRQQSLSNPNDSLMPSATHLRQ